MPDDVPAVNLLVEGLTDRVVVQRILEWVGLPCGKTFGEKGKGYLLRVLPDYNQAARFSPWVVVVDLDQAPECAPMLAQQYLPRPSAGMRFRVAVHAVEAWLLADIDTLAEFLAVPRTRFPSFPDAEPDPKATLVSLARQSKRRDVREDMVPRPGSGAKVGPAYTARLIEYVTVAGSAQWRPEVAAQRSDSLQRCIAALHTLKHWTPVP
ncbi:MAG: hypothetical protein KBH93_08850 [Anaerolineae bacterium]|nr:hypothetical protein [Anaerolineae bacterium]